MDSLIRSHACETGASGEHVQAQLRAMPRKPSSSDTQEEEEEETKKSHNDDNKNNIEKEEDPKEEEKTSKQRGRRGPGDGKPGDEPSLRTVSCGTDESRRDEEHLSRPRRREGGFDVENAETRAVVGNSGTLQKTAYGAMIDSAEAVFRVNDGVAKRGCSLYAGSRTTVRVVDAKAPGRWRF